MNANQVCPSAFLRDNNLYPVEQVEIWCQAFYIVLVTGNPHKATYSLTVSSLKLLQSSQELPVYSIPCHAHSFICK